MVYLLVFILLAIPVVKYDLFAKTGGENKWYYACLVALILLAGLRYRVGSDTLMYMSVFDDCPKLDELKYFDFAEAKYNPLWYVINAISRSIHDSFTCFQVIHAMFVNSVFFWFFRKYCPLYYFSAILLYYIGYFCYFNMEVMRESLCICIMLLAIPSYMNRKYFMYYVLCIIGVLFHYSAMLLFFLPLLRFFQKPSWKWQLVIFITIVLFVKVINVPTLLLNVLGFNEQMILLLKNYLDMERSLMGMLSEILKYLPIFILICVREANGISDRYDFTPIVMGVVIIYSMAMEVGGFARFINYFVPFIIVYSVNTLYTVLNMDFKSKQMTFLSSVAAFLLLLVNMASFYLGDVSQVYPNTRAYVRYLPYYSIFDPKIDEHRERFVENDREVIIQF